MNRSTFLRALAALPFVPALLDVQEEPEPDEVVVRYGGDLFHFDVESVNGVATLEIHPGPDVQSVRVWSGFRNPTPDEVGEAMVRSMRALREFGVHGTADAFDR